MNAARYTVATLALAASAAAAQPAAEPAEPPARPAPKFIDQENLDWRVLRQRDDNKLLDPIKDIRAPAIDGSDQGSFSLGGALRARYENFQNFLTRPGEDDGFTLTHIRLNASYWFAKRARVFAEGKSAFSTDRALPGGQRPLDTDTLDLQQGFAELTFDIAPGATARLRAGRHSLKFGNQRLVSPLPWANTLRAWDGGRADISVGGWTITPFFTLFAPVQKFEFNDPDTDIRFWGVYATGPASDELNIKSDVYFLALDRDTPVTFNGTAGDEQRRTVGARFYRPKGDDLDFDIEGALQFGEVGQGDVFAWFIDSELGWTFDAAPFAPRVFVGGGAASGDNSSGGDVETFNQLFPLGHAFLGIADQLGRQNIIEVRAGASAKVTEQISVSIAGHYFWRQSKNDAVYNVAGGVLRAPMGSDSTDVGAEFDIIARYKPGFGLTLEGGYARFFAGEFFEQTGPSNDVDFAYVQATLVF